MELSSEFRGKHDSWGKALFVVIACELIGGMPSHPNMDVVVLADPVRLAS